MTTTPLEAPCDNCRQVRPLFKYEPGCGLHLGAGAFTCPWCSIDKQPLLCTRCWGVRKEREDNDPNLIEEDRVMASICAANARVDARRQADRAACEAIAAVPQEAGP